MDKFVQLVPTMVSTKYTFMHNFFPTKQQEVEHHLNPANIHQRVPNRVLLEIRDALPPPVINPSNPWTIRKTLTYQEIFLGRILLSFQDTFDHVLRYWGSTPAKLFAEGKIISMPVWDVTKDEDKKKYENDDGFNLYFGAGDSGVLACAEMMRDRQLKVGDEICLFWDSTISGFMFKLIML